MAYVEHAAAVRWAVGQLNADATLTGLIAGGKVYQLLPRGTDIKSKPGVSVLLQATAPPTGPIRSGPRTWTSQDVTLTVKVAQQAHTTTQMEPVAGQVLTLLDGQYYGSVAGGTMYQSLYTTTVPVSEPLGDEQILNWNMMFVVTIKTS